MAISKYRIFARGRGMGLALAAELDSYPGKARMPRDDASSLVDDNWIDEAELSQA